MKNFLRMLMRKLFRRRKAIKMLADIQEKSGTCSCGADLHPENRHCTGCGVRSPKFVPSRQPPASTALHARDPEGDHLETITSYEDDLSLFKANQFCPQCGKKLYPYK